jgi:DNA ligase-1
MEFEAFAGRAAAIEAESADTAVVAAVTDLLSAAGGDLTVVARFVQGEVVPARESTTLDVGPTLCYEAIARAAGPNVSANDVEARLADRGDVGEVAASYDLGGQRGLAAFAGGADPLSVGEVERRLREVAGAAGDGSRDRKVETLFGLFTRAGDDEARYLARLVLGEMRIGVGSGSVRDAVAAAFDVPAGAVERAMQVTNDVGMVAERAREEGLEGLEAMGLEVGRPVAAMLAQAGTAEDALGEWEAVAVDTKYDGARVQVHYDGDSVRLFSRNLEEVTGALPEVVERVSGEVADPAILDGEVVAVDDDGGPLPFQEVLRRFRRKHDVAAAREAVSVELHPFDCLHADGEDLLDAPLSVRHDRLRQVVEGVDPLTTTDDADRVAAVEAAALEAGHEGIMLKNPDSPYTPGSRGRNWLKRKPDVETLDLVVTGAEWGEGRRASLLGTFLLSARDGEESYATIGKVATGITDEDLDRLTDLLEPHVVGQDGQDLDVRPAVVFEVGYEEIQASPTYSSGYALRFPRFVGVREDLDPGEADSIARIERLAEADGRDG